MTVSPLGKVHFCAELGGNAMTGECSVVAALRLTIINNRTVEKNFASDMRDIDVTEASPRWRAVPGYFLDPAGFAARIPGRAFTADFAGANGFTKTSSKS